MALRVFLGLVVTAAVIRFAPILALRLLFLVPRPRLVRTVRLIRAASSTLIAPSHDPDCARSPVRIKLLVVSSSLLALMALIATALLKWHSAALMLLLR